jgi:hypothetical protein
MLPGSAMESGRRGREREGLTVGPGATWASAPREGTVRTKTRGEPLTGGAHWPTTVDMTRVVGTGVTGKQGPHAERGERVPGKGGALTHRARWQRARGGEASAH